MYIVIGKDCLKEKYGSIIMMYLVWSTKERQYTHDMSPYNIN